MNLELQGQKGNCTRHFICSGSKLRFLFFEGLSYRVARYIREEKLLGRSPVKVLNERSLHNINYSQQ